MRGALAKANGVPLCPRISKSVAFSFCSLGCSIGAPVGLLLGAVMENLLKDGSFPPEQILSEHTQSPGWF